MTILYIDPIADSSLSWLNPLGDSHYDKIDDWNFGAADDDTTYIEDKGSVNIDWFKFESFTIPSGKKIVSVKATVRHRQTSTLSGLRIQPLLKNLSGQTGYGSSAAAITTYATTTLPILNPSGESWETIVGPIDFAANFYGGLIALNGGGKLDFERVTALRLVIDYDTVAATKIRLSHETDLIAKENIRLSHDLNKHKGYGKRLSNNVDGFYLDKSIFFDTDSYYNNWTKSTTDDYWEHLDDYPVTDTINDWVRIYLSPNRAGASIIFRILNDEMSEKYIAPNRFIKFKATIKTPVGSNLLFRFKVSSGVFTGWSSLISSPTTAGEVIGIIDCTGMSITQLKNIYFSLVIYSHVVAYSYFYIYGMCIEISDNGKYFRRLSHKLSGYKNVQERIVHDSLVRYHGTEIISDTLDVQKFEINKVSEEANPRYFRYDNISNKIGFEDFDYSDSVWWDENWYKRRQINFTEDHKLFKPGDIARTQLFTGYEITVPTANCVLNEGIEHSSRQIAFHNNSAYVAWLGYSAGANYHIYVSRYSYDSATWDVTYDIANSLTSYDSHHYPYIHIGSDGYVRVVVGNHGSVFRMFVSNTPGIIDTWKAPVNVGGELTYPRLIEDSSGAYWLFARKHDILGEPAQYAQYYSPDGFSFVSTPDVIIDYADNYGGSGSMYCGGAVYINNRMHLVNTFWDYYQSANKGRAISYIYSDDFNSWYYADGTLACTTASALTYKAVEEADQFVATSSFGNFPNQGPYKHTNTEALAIDQNNRPHFLYQEWYNYIGEMCDLHYAKWNGTDWIDLNLQKDIGGPQMFRYRQGSHLYLDENKTYVYFFAKPENVDSEEYFGGEMYRYVGNNLGEEWTYGYMTKNTGFGAGMMSVLPTACPQGRLIFLCRGRKMYIYNDKYYPFVQNDGDDVRIVRHSLYNGEYSFHELNRLPDRFQGEDTNIIFPIDTYIPTNASSNAHHVYYIYYGNGAATNPKRDVSSVIPYYENFESYVSNSYITASADSGWKGTASKFKVINANDMAAWTSAHTNKLWSGDSFLRTDGFVVTGNTLYREFDIPFVNAWFNCKIWKEGAGIFYIELFDSADSKKFVRVRAYSTRFQMSTAEAWWGDVYRNISGQYHDLLIRVNNNGVSCWVDNSALGVNRDSGMYQFDTIRYVANQNGPNYCYDTFVVWNDSGNEEPLGQSFPYGKVFLANTDEEEGEAAVGFAHLSNMASIRYHRDIRIAQDINKNKLGAVKIAEEIIADIHRGERISSEVSGNKTTVERILSLMLSADKIVLSRIVDDLQTHYLRHSRLSTEIVSDKYSQERIVHDTENKKIRLERLVFAIVGDKIEATKIVNDIVANKIIRDRFSQILSIDKTLKQRLTSIIEKDKIKIEKIVSDINGDKILIENISSILDADKTEINRIAEEILVDKILLERFISNDLISDKYSVVRLLHKISSDKEVVTRLYNAIVSNKYSKTLLVNTLLSDKFITATIVGAIVADKYSIERLAGSLSSDVYEYERIVSALDNNKILKEKIVNNLSLEDTEISRVAQELNVDKFILIRLLMMAVLDKKDIYSIANEAETSFQRVVLVCHDLTSNKEMISRIHNAIPTANVTFDRLSMLINGDKIDLDRLGSTIPLDKIDVIKLAEYLASDKKLTEKISSILNIDKTETDRIVEEISGDKILLERFVSNGLVSDKYSVVRLLHEISKNKITRIRFSQALFIDKIMKQRLASIIEKDKIEAEKIVSDINGNKILTNTLSHMIKSSKIIYIKLAQSLVLSKIGLMKIAHDLNKDIHEIERIVGIIPLEGNPLERLHNILDVNKYDITRIIGEVPLEKEDFHRLANYLEIDKFLSIRLSDILNLEATNYEKMAQIILSDKSLNIRLNHEISTEKTLYSKIAEGLNLDKIYSERLSCWSSLISNDFYRICSLLELDKKETELVSNIIDFQGSQTIRLSEDLSLNKITNIRLPNFIPISKIVSSRIAMSSNSDKSLLIKLSNDIILEATGSDRISQILEVNKEFFIRLNNILSVSYLQIARLASDLSGYKKVIISISNVAAFFLADFYSPIIKQAIIRTIGAKYSDLKKLNVEKEVIKRLRLENYSLKTFSFNNYKIRNIDNKDEILK